MRAGARFDFLARQVAAAACLVFCIGFSTTARAQPKRYRPPPDYVQLGKPDQAEGRKILEDVRERVPVDYYWEFQLRVMPRRGDERTTPGRIWVGHNDRGPISRVSLTDGDKGAERRLLVQNGAQSAVWSWRSDDPTTIAPLPLSGLFDPLVGTNLTAFDLEMSFLYWPDFVFEGVAKVRGRPAHVFLLYPPPDIAAQKPDLTGVRVYVDTQFHAPVQVEQIGAENRPLKAITVLDVKKVGDQWILKSIDLRDEITRDKTRLNVTAAAVGIQFPPTLFAPATLTEAIRPPPADRVQRIEP